MYIHKLMTTGKFFFLSRPRRFGKSMLISTMASYFRGDRELFRGLAIDRLEPEEWVKYPVLRLDFTRNGYGNAGDLQKALNAVLDEWEREYGESNPDDSPEMRFDKLIRFIYESTGKQVVVLIDEYDSPIVDAYGNHELETANRNSHHDFIDEDDIEGFLHEMQSFLAGIPYLAHTDKEPQWQKDILIISRLVGLNIDAERRTSRGRMDMVLEGGKAIYILEFKYGATPEEALVQINEKEHTEKEYALPFENRLNHKSIVKVGVNISPETRNIDGWIIE